MKKLLISAIASLFSVAIFAQGTINIATNDNKTFTLKNLQNGNTAGWSLEGVAQPDGTSFTYQFTAAGSYSVIATPKNTSTTCVGTPYTVTVNVVNDITTTDIQVGWSSIADVCSGINTTNASVTLQDINNASHSFTATDVLVVYFKVANGTEQSATATITAGSGSTTADFSIPTNALSTGSKNVVITKFSFNGTQTDYASVAASKTTSFTVSPVPSIDGVE